MKKIELNQEETKVLFDTLEILTLSATKISDKMYVTETVYLTPSQVQELIVIKQKIGLNGKRLDKTERIKKCFVLIDKLIDQCRKTKLKDEDAINYHLHHLYDLLKDNNDS